MGQEIGVTPLQTISLVSTIANDGVYTPPRIVAGELPPDSKALPVVFHPAQQHRVVSTMTAAQMKKMMEGVVLFGTARRAILDGYTVAGKTGTAQKVDPSDRRLFQDKVRGLVHRLCAGQHPGHHDCGDSRFADRSAPGRPGLRAGVQAHRAAGAGVPARAARSGCEDIRSGRRWWHRRRTTEDESSDHLGAPLQDDQTTASTTQTPATHPPSVSKATPLADVKATAPRQRQRPRPEVMQAQNTPPVRAAVVRRSTPRRVELWFWMSMAEWWCRRSWENHCARRWRRRSSPGWRSMRSAAALRANSGPHPAVDSLAGQHITVRFAH